MLSQAIIKGRSERSVPQQSEFSHGKLQSMNNRLLTTMSAESLPS